MLPDLGKYAVYVLSAYGVSLALILLLVLFSVIRARRVRRELEEIEARQGRVAAPAPAGGETANG